MAADIWTGLGDVVVSGFETFNDGIRRGDEVLFEEIVGALEKLGIRCSDVLGQNFERELFVLFMKGEIESVTSVNRTGARLLRGSDPGTLVARPARMTWQSRSRPLRLDL